MKLIPILFKPEMVAAILDGRKTMTRRVMKLKHLNGHEVKSIHKDGSGKGWIAWSPREVSAEETAKLYPGEEGFKCPYGNPGDILWVRETWRFIDHSGTGIKYFYKAGACKTDLNDRSINWKPSLFMPKDACRLFLEITNFRVERLQDINEADATAEGCISTAILNKEGDDYTGLFASEHFHNLWESINGKESWKENPWLWVVEFKVSARNDYFTNQKVPSK
jgi:hypothetical protein